MSDPAPAPVAEPQRWRLQLSGCAQLLGAGGERIVLERRDAALLALLAIEGPMARLRAMVLLWPDESESVLRGRLRQRLFALKRKLGADVVEGKGTLALTPAVQWSGLDAEAPEGELLGDAEHADMPEFALWLAAGRQRLQGLRRERLAGEASALEQQGRVAEAIVSAERLLALEPLQEHAHRRLMRLHYLRGDRAAALLAFDRCERLLKDEVGAVPSAETLELLAQIERAEPPAAPAGLRVVPASVLRPPRVIGRDAEWALLLAAWERGDAIVVIGEAGMGKTRLVADLLLARAARPGQALQVAARPGDEQVPYALLGRLLRGLLAARTTRLPEGTERELGRLLPELRQPAQSAPGTEAARQARFVGAIESTLHDAVAAGLEAVALDDLHFADAASLEMAQHLAGTPGVRWLAAMRGAEVGPAGQALVDTFTARLRAEPVVLQPLTRTHVGELVQSLAITVLDAPPLADALHQRTGGNPLFLLETLKALLLQAGPGNDGLADGSALARLPPGGSALRLIERRIGQLSREAVRLARCAAVAGQDFSAGLAARVLEVNPLDLADAWTELESAQVMRDGAFAHDLIFEAARASVPDPIARVLHRRLAELLASDGAAPARLAVHWLGAGEDLRAAPHLAAAGRQALSAMRMREGVDLLDQAQAIYGRAGDADAQCALIDELLSTAVMAGSFDRVQRLVEQAAQHATSDRQRAMALRCLASLLGHRGEYLPAKEVAQQALSAALAARDRGCELGARGLLAELLAQLGFAAEAEAVLRPIEPWVREQGSDSQRLVHADALANVLQDAGRLAQALDQWQQAIDSARRGGAAHLLPGLLGQRAITLFISGRAAEARAGLLESMELLQDIPGNAMILRTVSQRLQVMDRSLGDYAASLKRGEDILADPEAGPAEIDEARFALAFCYLDLGQTARVQRHLAQGDASRNDFDKVAWKDLAAQFPQPAAQQQRARRAALDVAADAVRKWSGRNLLSAWRVQARYHDDDGEAAAAARQAVEYATGSGMGGQQLVFQAFLAQRLARLGDPAQAVLLARDSWRLMAGFTSGVVYRGEVWQALIEVLEPHDAALARTIARSAADWIYRTAAEHVPPAFRESFLQRNPWNAFVLAKVRESPSRD